MEETRLWEPEHPYYCNEGCYHANGYHHAYASWADFMEATGNSDPDLNLLFRWDWKRALDENEDPIDAPGSTLSVFFVAQRKGYTFSAEVVVTPEDEPTVRAWLVGRWQTMLAIWAPISLVASGGAGE